MRMSVFGRSVGATPTAYRHHGDAGRPAAHSAATMPPWGGGDGPRPGPAALRFGRQGADQPEIAPEQGIVLQRYTAAAIEICPCVVAVVTHAQAKAEPQDSVVAQRHRVRVVHISG